MKKGKGDKKRKLPSRERYEKNKPVVSFRVPKEVYDKLQAVTKKTGMSRTDILKVGLGLIKVKIRTEEEIRKEIYDDVLVEGHTLAVERFMVVYQCSECGRPIELDSPEEKKAAAQYMTEHGWRHSECHKRRDQR